MSPRFRSRGLGRAATAAVIIGVLAAFLAACTPAPGGAPLADDGLASRMIARVNHHRAAAGLAPLSPDARLAAAAAGHAGAMAQHDFFAHERVEDDTFAARAARAGYSWRLIAENIAAGLATPEATVDGWMESAGHRANMLNPRLRDAGVGHARIDPDPGAVRYRHYWVLMLGTPAEPPGRQGRPASSAM